MVAPSQRSLGAVVSATTANPSFGEPAGAASTDVIEIKFFVDGLITVTAAPTGFSVAPSAPVVADSPAGGDHSQQVYWARRSDAGAGPYAFTLSASTFVEGRAAAIQDCITTGNPYEDSDGAFDVGLVNTAPLVTATAGGPDRYASYGATNWSGGAWTEPSGYIERWDANNQIITFDDKALTDSETTTPQAVCVGTDRMTGWVGILLPVANEAVSPPAPVLPPPLLYMLVGRYQAQWTASAAEAQASSGVGEVTQRSETGGTGVKQAAAESTAQQRSSTTSTAAKQGLGAGASTQRSSTTDVGVKQGLGAGASTQRSSTTSAAAKQAAGEQGAVAHTSTSATGQAQSAGIGVAQARAVTGASSDTTGRAGSGSASAHVSTTSAGAKQAVGAGAAVAHSSTVATTGAPATSGAGDAVAHVSSASTGAKVGAGTQSASARVATSASGQRTTGGQGIVEQRSTSATISIKQTSGVGVVPVHPATQASAAGPEPEILMGVLFNAITGLTQCVANELAGTSEGAPQRVCLFVPGQIAWDKCECGQLASTISRIYWSENFPNPSLNPGVRSNCEAPYLVADFTISITRCVPSGVRDQPPTCEQLLAAALIWDEDARAVRNGAGCCLIQYKNDPGLIGTGLFEFVLRDQTAVGPQGGCVGSELHLSVGVASAICC